MKKNTEIATLLANSFVFNVESYYRVTPLPMFSPGLRTLIKTINAYFDDNGLVKSTGSLQIILIDWEIARDIQNMLNSGKSVIEVVALYNQLEAEITDGLVELIGAPTDDDIDALMSLIDDVVTNRRISSRREVLVCLMLFTTAFYSNSAIMVDNDELFNAHIAYKDQLYKAPRDQYNTPKNHFSKTLLDC